MQTRARLSIIASMAIFGTIGLFVRAISVTSAELALYRAVIAAVMLTGYFLISRTSLRLGEIKKELPLLLLSGAAMGFNWILLFEAYKYTCAPVWRLHWQKRGRMSCVSMPMWGFAIWIFLLVWQTSLPSASPT